jgi:hypothetical protein
VADHVDRPHDEAEDCGPEGCFVQFGQDEDACDDYGYGQDLACFVLYPSEFPGYFFSKSHWYSLICWSLYCLACRQYSCWSFLKSSLWLV